MNGRKNPAGIPKVRNVYRTAVCRLSKLTLDRVIRFEWIQTNGRGKTMAAAFRIRLNQDGITFISSGRTETDYSAATRSFGFIMIQVMMKPIT